MGKLQILKMAILLVCSDWIFI
ncbi:MAG: hypothetical protein PWQ17_2704, partial [Anaerophaga sp.]|nr:hypothetical protein [Anaerophaga sp.]